MYWYKVCVMFCIVIFSLLTYVIPGDLRRGLPQENFDALIKEEVLPSVLQNLKKKKQNQTETTKRKNE